MLNMEHPGALEDLNEAIEAHLVAVEAHSKVPIGASWLIPELCSWKTHCSHGGSPLSQVALPQNYAGSPWTHGGSLGQWKLTLDPWRLTLESWRLTLESQLSACQS
jgi:hypothetical protein